MITVFISVAFGIGGSMLISVSFADNLKQERKVAINSYQSVLGMLAVVNSVSHQAYYGDVVDVLRQLEENGSNWAGMRLAMGGDILYERNSGEIFSRKRANIRFVYSNGAITGICRCPVPWKPEKRRCIWMGCMIFLRYISPEVCNRGFIAMYLL